MIITCKGASYNCEKKVTESLLIVLKRVLKREFLIYLYKNEVDKLDLETSSRIKTNGRCNVSSNIFYAKNNYFTLSLDSGYVKSLDFKGTLYTALRF